MRLRITVPSPLTEYTNPYTSVVGCFQIGIHHFWCLAQIRGLSLTGFVRCSRGAHQPSRFASTARWGVGSSCESAADHWTEACLWVSMPQGPFLPNLHQGGHPRPTPSAQSNHEGHSANHHPVLARSPSPLPCPVHNRLVPSGNLWLLLSAIRPLIRERPRRPIRWRWAISWLIRSRQSVQSFTFFVNKNSPITL
ncbi:hypothetical protein VTK26DRAFT_8351 [Humicola hyalothermophila]